MTLLLCALVAALVAVTQSPCMKGESNGLQKEEIQETPQTQLLEKTEKHLQIQKGT